MQATMERSIGVNQDAGHGGWVREGRGSGHEPAGTQHRAASGRCRALRVHDGHNDGRRRRHSGTAGGDLLA